MGAFTSSQPNDVALYDIDMDGSMERSEDGEWVRADDWYALQAELHTAQQKIEQLKLICNYAYGAVT